MSPHDEVPGHLPFLPRQQWFMLSIFVAPDNLDLSTTSSRIAFVESHLHQGLFGLKVNKVHQKRLKGNLEWCLLFKEMERLVQFRIDCLARYQCYEAHDNPPYVLRGSLCDYDSPFDAVYLSLVLESHHPRREWLWTHMPAPLYRSFGSVLGSSEAQPSSLPHRQYTIDLERVDESLLEQLGENVEKIRVWFILRSIYFYHLDPVRLPSQIHFKSYLQLNSVVRDVCLSLATLARHCSNISVGPESISLTNRACIIALRR